MVTTGLHKMRGGLGWLLVAAGPTGNSKTRMVMLGHRLILYHLSYAATEYSRLIMRKYAPQVSSLPLVICS